MLRVCFNCYGSYTTDTVFQWDLNHILEIRGLTVDHAPTVHFCNRKSETAIVVQSEIDGDAIIAPVPNQLLQEPYNIIAYVHVYDENHAKTVEIVNIPLTKRVKPDDYQFTENVDVMSFERLEKDITDFIALMTGNFNDHTAEVEDEINTFTSDMTNNFNNHTAETDDTLSEYKTEMNTTLQLCRDAVTALQLEYRNLDGGTPTTEEELYDENFNGGYPVDNT